MQQPDEQPPSRAVRSRQTTVTLAGSRSWDRMSGRGRREGSCCACGAATGSSTGVVFSARAARLVRPTKSIPGTQGSGRSREDGGGIGNDAASGRRIPSMRSRVPPALGWQALAGADRTAARVEQGEVGPLAERQPRIRGRPSTSDSASRCRRSSPFEIDGEKRSQSVGQSGRAGIRRGLRCWCSADRRVAS